MPTEAKPQNLDSYSYWNDQMSASLKLLTDKFHKRGDQVVNKFLDEEQDVAVGGKRLNIFHANITTLRSMLYGQLPKVEVSRRYQDSEDDVARVAGEILQRMLNNDIELTVDSFQDSLRGSLDDFLIPGLGVAKVRYDFDPEKEVTHFDYVNWKDIIWSDARTWNEVRWVAFRTYLYKEEVAKKWGSKVADRLEYKSSKSDEEAKKSDPDQAAEVWEIWCKDTRRVYWFSFGYEDLIETKNDFLKLSGFFPCPKLMMANTTSKKLLPKPEFCFAQDLYGEIDELETRIARLTEACKLVGVYDSKNKGVQDMMTEGKENELIPVENWAAFSEKGGLKGVIDWMPIEEISKVIDVLTQKLNEKIALLYQVTGMSDILRGATDPRETKGAQELKSKYASVRIQAMQDMFAEFASDLQKMKAEIIIRHYSEETIIKQSNITNTQDRMLVPEAVKLIKTPDAVVWRIQVRPESVAMIDYAQIKQERTEYINALALFLQSSAPIVELDIGVVPTLLELLKWGLAGFKGSSQIEGVLDRAVAQAQQAIETKKATPPPPDPKVEAVKMKAQADMQQSQQEAQLKMQEMQAQMQMELTKFREEMQMEREKFELEKQKLLLDIQAKQMELSMKREEQQMDLAAKREEQQLNLQGKVLDAEIQRETAESNLEMTEVSNQQKLKSAEEMSKIKAKQAKKPRKSNDT